MGVAEFMNSQPGNSPRRKHKSTNERHAGRRVGRRVPPLIAIQMGGAFQSQNRRELRDCESKATIK